MKVEVVGTSCNWFLRANTSFVIDGKGLFDVPGGNYKRIIKNNDIFDLDWIFISHLHDDHVMDLKIITTRFIRENHGRTEKLRLYGPPGLIDFIVRMQKLFFGGKDESDIAKLKEHIDFIEVFDGMEFREGEYKIKVFKMNHGSCETYGLTFFGKKTIAFSSDTADCESLRRMLEVSDYAFVDMASVAPHRRHLSAKEFVDYTKIYPNCKMFPVHTSDEAQEFAKNNGLNFLEDGQILNLD